MLLHSTETSCSTPVVFTKLTAVCQLNLLKSHTSKPDLAANILFALFLTKGTEGHHFVQTLVLANVNIILRAALANLVWLPEIPFYKVYLVCSMSLSGYSG